MNKRQRPSAIVRRIPRGKATPALEIKAAIERSFPSALLRLRLNDRSRPSSPGTSTEIRRIVTQPDPESLDQRMLSDSLAHPASEGRDLFKKNGFEAIAWYQPFHRYDEGAWGIYLDAQRLDAGVASLSLDLKKSSPRPHELAARLMLGLVIAHEMFHARTEFAAAWLEMASRRRSYRSYQERVYSKVLLTEECREEALANWSADRWLGSHLSSFVQEGLVKDLDAVRKTVHDWLDFSPAGYRDWRDGDGDDAWARLATELASGHVHAEAGRKVPLPIDGLLRADDLLDLQGEDVPVYCVGRGAIADALFSAPSRREALRVLKHCGYRLLPGRGKGSHEIWEGPDGRAFTIPLRDPLSVGVFHQLLAHFGWTKQQYVREIRALT